MNRQETGINSNDSNQHKNSDLESEVSKKLQISNEKPGSSSSTAVKKLDSGSDLTGDDQNGKNPTLIQDDSLSSISTDMKEQEEKDEMMDSKDILFNLTEEEKALAQNVFGNYLTFGKILDNSSLHKLFEFRLVNKFWAAEGTFVIMKAPMNQLFLKYKSERRCHEVWLPAESFAKGSLRELNNCVSASRQFPCSNIRIFDFGYMDSDDMTEFFRLHGEEIKTLTFFHPGYFSGIAISSLRKILLEQAPNIRKLKIDTKILAPNGELLFPEKVVLPHLRFLHFSHYCSQILEIIWASPNLQEIRGDTFQAFDALISMGKIYLVKELDINSDESGSLKLVQKWAEAKLKFTNLGLVNPTLNMGKPLSKILDGSRESLANMELHLKEDFFTGVLWPKFENVQSLLVQNVRNGLQFPQNFISDVFPNITKLEINSGHQELESVSRLLTTDTQLPCLKTVQLWNGNPDWLNLLLRAAPNVEELNVQEIHDFYSTVGLVWGFSRLKKLTLASDLWHEVQHINTFPQLDMAITGLSEEMVRRLHEDPVYFEEMKMKGQEIPRVTPSILDCQALETLTLHFRYHGAFGRGNPTLFTAVSGEFGFNLSPINVNVVSYNDDGVAFSSLAPYVKIVVKP